MTRRRLMFRTEGGEPAPPAEPEPVPITVLRCQMGFRWSLHLQVPTTAVMEKHLQAIPGIEELSISSRYSFVFLVGAAFDAGAVALKVQAAAEKLLIELEKTAASHKALLQTKIDAALAAARAFNFQHVSGMAALPAITGGYNVDGHTADTLEDAADLANDTFFAAEQEAVAAASREAARCTRFMRGLLSSYPDRHSIRFLQVFLQYWRDERSFLPQNPMRSVPAGE